MIVLKSNRYVTKNQCRLANTRNGWTEFEMGQCTGFRAHANNRKFTDAGQRAELAVYSSID